MNVSIHAKLLTYAYFGSIKPIQSGVFAETLTLPSIYTFAGSFISRLIELGLKNGSSPEEMVNNIVDEIKKDRLKIKGVYIHYNGKYYVPITPYIIYNKNKDDRRLRLPVSDNFKEIEGYGTSPFHKSSYLVPNFKGLDKGDMKERYYVEINNIKEDARVKSIKFKHQERIRTALDYDKKIPVEDKLFSLSMLNINGDINSKNDLYFCIDVESDDTQIELDRWIGKFGGEGSIAEFTIKEPHLQIESKQSDTYLAVSHIPIKNDNDTLITKFGKIKYIIGRVTQLGGWDLYNNKMKRIYACIEPGSIFKVYNDNINRELFTEWYSKLLSTVIPINGLE